MEKYPDIASLWIGGRLSFLEQLCIKSFVDRGHAFTLYAYDEVEGVPKGVTVKDAAEIYDHRPFRVHLRHNSPAIHADFFRIKLMLKDMGVIWADTDAYCHKPIDIETPHIFGWQGDEVNNAILRMPADSFALFEFEAFLEDPHVLPPWLPKDIRDEVDHLRNRGFVIPIEAMPWGVSGPQGLTYFLRRSGEIGHAMPETVFYPMNWQSRRLFLKAPRNFMKHTTDQTLVYHFLGRIVRRILIKEYDGLPKAGCMLDYLCEKHEIDPKDAPIIPYKPTE